MLFEKLKNILTKNNIQVGYLYFFIHFVTEVACFYFLGCLYGNNAYMWAFALIYDALAFVPQSLIGYISDKIPKINFGILGTILLTVALILLGLELSFKYIALIILCIGNCCLHVSGAEATLKTSDGKLSHSAIFVAGGSFGVITGKLLAKTNLSYIFITLLVLTMIPFILLAETYKEEKDKKRKVCEKFNYHSLKISPGIIIILAMLIVVVRGYMGYGIPTSWNKTTLQSILLFSFMGIGKGLGGIISDLIGVKKTAIWSTILALPFLLFGDNVMVVSLIGVMFFSMTMSITLALLVSVLKNTPGLAFGLTTIGLFLGTIPIFFIKFMSTLSNCMIIIILSILCLIIMKLIIREDKDV